MKKIKFVFVAFLLVAFASCKSDAVSKDSIVGKWKVSKVDNQMKQFLQEEAAPMKKRMEEAFMQAEYEFKADGTYSIQSVFPKSGSWSYDEANNAIELKSDKGDEINVYSIVKGTATQLDIKNDKGEAGFIAFTLEKVVSQ